MSLNVNNILNICRAIAPKALKWNFFRKILGYSQKTGFYNKRVIVSSRLFNEEVLWKLLSYIIFQTIFDHRKYCAFIGS